MTKFSCVLDRYSRYLLTSGDRKHLLHLGHRLFGGPSKSDSSPEPPIDFGNDRPSFLLLCAKEAELKLPPLDPPTKPREAPPRNRRGHLASVASEQLSEEIMLVQDRNAVLLKRRKFLERARDAKNRKYCALMEQSVQQKVKLRLEVQKLKGELAHALARAQPGVSSRSIQMSQKAAMSEICDLNQLILLRVNSFKIDLSRNTVAIDRTVMTRFKAEMEAILGHIYEHSESLPANVVLERFHVLAEDIEREVKAVETQLYHEHERNDQLQREASELGNSLTAQLKEVDALRKHSAKREAAIATLRDVANREIEARQDEYQRLIGTTADDGAAPTSGRAMIVTTGKEHRKITRTASRHMMRRKESATPQVNSKEELIAEQLSLLQELVTQELARPVKEASVYRPSDSFVCDKSTP
jgi:hypothetical protein